MLNNFLYGYLAFGYPLFVRCLLSSFVSVLFELSVHFLLTCGGGLYIWDMSSLSLKRIIFSLCCLLFCGFAYSWIMLCSVRHLKVKVKNITCRKVMPVDTKTSVQFRVKITNLMVWYHVDQLNE